MFALSLIAVLWILYFVARFYESGSARAYASELHRVWASWNVPLRCLMCLLLICCALQGGSKGESPVAGLYRLLFWASSDAWPLIAAYDYNHQSEASVSSATNSIRIATNTSAAVVSQVASNKVWTISQSWHSPNRLPWSERQNVIGRTVKVAVTNINGVLCEDHYVAFNYSATTNPAVILIEYARTLPDGTVERYSAPTITNSYPNMYTVTLQSGVHTCYWFRCEVPLVYINSVRDHSGEALFGSPDGSGKGFDMLGTIIVDRNGELWQGATTNIVANGVTNVVKNGVIFEEQQ